jgi:hypothetical protein
MLRPMTGPLSVEARWPYDPVATLDDDDLRYRVEVLAANVGDLVTHTGGWIFDLAKAGWDVAVVVYGREGTLPIRILGVNVVEFNQRSVDDAARRYPQLLAVAPDLLEQHPDVRRRISEAIDAGVTEAVVWGPSVSEADDHRVDVLAHEPSNAARIFKSRALALDGGPHTEPIDGIELFQRLHAHERVRIDAKLSGTSAASLAFDPFWDRRATLSGPSVITVPVRRDPGSRGVEVGSRRLSEARHCEG